jgi:hypothetical protein
MGVSGLATKTVVSLTDDLDGSEATTTFQFTVDGVDYRIDLSDANARKFEKAMAKYTDVATRLGRSTGRGAAARSGASARREDTAAIRQWAAANGWPVSDRGRIPATVLAAYEAASS